MPPMKYGWLIAMACLSSAAGLSPAVAVANDASFAVTASAQIGVTIPARFNATVAEGEFCVQSTGSYPYTTAFDDDAPSVSTGHCLAKDPIHFQSEDPITLWVIPE